MRSSSWGIRKVTDKDVQALREALKAGRIQEGTVKIEDFGQPVSDDPIAERQTFEEINELLQRKILQDKNKETQAQQQQREHATDTL